MTRRSEFKNEEKVSGSALIPQYIEVDLGVSPCYSGVHFTVFDREIELKRESGEHPELPRSGKQERKLR